MLFNLPFLSGWLKHIPVPVLNCYACPLASGACPIGSLQYLLISGQVPWLTLGMLGVFGLLAGRFYCGKLCPFGLVQDLLAKITRKKKTLPLWFGNLKYGSLGLLTVILPLIFLTPVFCKLCPAGALEASLPIIGIEFYQKLSGTLPFGFSPILDMLSIWFAIKMLILGFFIMGSVFFKRPFCQICPLGAIFSLFNRFRLTPAPALNLSACSSCGKCQSLCPAGIDPSKKLNSHNCIQCGECEKQVCPAQMPTK